MITKNETKTMSLSIITINYNNREGLQRTIESVLAQTWKDFEWIVIDGGSTDGSRELIEQYQEYFAYWCSEPDKGVYNAMNKGIAKAHGGYLNFMNSGDTFYEAETLKKVFDEPRSADILYGDWIVKYIDRDVHDGVAEEDLTKRLWHNNICHQSMFFRSILLKDNNYDESMKLMADWKRNTELTLDGASFKHINATICIYDAYGKSSHWDETYYQERERVLSLYPSYMQQAMQELTEFTGNHHIMMLREILLENSWIASLTKSLITVHFWIMLIIKRIQKTLTTK